MRPPAMVLVVVLLASAAGTALASGVVLERALPLKGVPLEHLRELDRARHARMGPWVNLTLEGTFNPFSSGLYYASVKLGNPPKKHTFRIDTGSSTSWVACKGCTDCLNKSVANISTELYNPDSSSTSSKIPCLSFTCAAAGETRCKTPFAPCGYDFPYGDGSRVSGYYVKDIMYFDTIMGKQLSASVVFGCTNSVSHYFGTDGLLGFGQTQLSIISQLNSQGLSPKVFSHCLKGSEGGGGILVLGKIMAPRLVYTPIASRSQHLYTLNLESIAVNGQKLPIDSSLFATSNSKGTVVDSGSTLVYLVDGAYQPLVSAIFAAISPSLATYNLTWTRADKCFQASSSIDMLFPTVTLYFKGGAAMTVEPSQYLLQQGNNVIGNHVVWCIAWKSSQEHPNIQGMTILGDIVLHDKIIVYDLGKQRVGWTDYNCSSLNITSSFDVSGASPYSTGLIAIGVAVVWLGIFLTG